MTQGLVALTGFQAGIEETRGTPVAATRIQPMTATLSHKIERYAPQEDRNSFEDFYRSSQTKESVEISGATAWATFEDMAFFGLLAVKGGVTPTGTGDYTWDFLPSSDTDDLATITAEWFNDTASYQVPWCVLNKLELSYQRGQPVALSLDFLGQTAIEAAKTADLPQRVTEDITDGLTATFIDDATIGTTAAPNVLTAKFSLNNNWEPIWSLDGNKYPSRFARGRRHVEGDFMLQFDSTSEYDKFVDGSARAVRLASTGSLIPETEVNKYLSFDFWTGGWDVADFGRQGGIWTVGVKGRSTYDATAGASFAMSVVNGYADPDGNPPE